HAAQRGKGTGAAIHQIAGKPETRSGVRGDVRMSQQAIERLTAALEIADDPYRTHLARLSIMPLVGELGDALYSFSGMRPARNAERPAWTASFMASAIRTGSPAAAMAVFMSTPSQPSSMAMAASLAVPTPASTSTGTRA